MRSVLDLFQATFPEIRVGVDDAAEMDVMPLESNCGADCKRVIEAAQPLTDLVRKAHGPYALRYVEPIANSVRSLCLLYICG